MDVILPVAFLMLATLVTVILTFAFVIYFTERRK